MSAERLDHGEADKLRRVAKALGLAAAILRLDDSQLADAVLAECGLPPATTRCTNDEAAQLIGQRSIWYRAARAISAAEWELEKRGDRQDAKNGVRKDQLRLDGEDDELVARDRRLRAQATQWSRGTPHEDAAGHAYDLQLRGFEREAAARAQQQPSTTDATDPESRARQRRLGHDADRWRAKGHRPPRRLP